MPFSEQRLPHRLAFGSTGGVERRTDIVTLASGFEARSTPWANGRRRYLIGGGVRTLAEAAELTAFFEARRGRLNGFRFKDFADFQSCPPGEAVSAFDESIGTGDGHTSTFQLVKTYGAAPDSYLRPIRKPVAGTVVLAVAAMLQSGGVAFDPATGIVTFTVPPANGAPVTAGFEFDTPVRFDIDRLDVTLESFDAARVSAFPLIEVRV